MVKPLGPAKFYGRSLPRPRIYTDVKFSSKRIDPPTPVLESLMRWANDAHWSMGGLCFHRKRAQGKIEGSVKNLRAEKEENKNEEEQKKDEEKKEEKQKEEDQSANGDESTANVTPPMEPHHVVEEDTPDFVPDSYRRPSRRRSPRVPSRVRKLGGVFEQQALHRKGSVYVPKRKLSPELEVFDWIPVPDKFINVTARRTSPRKKDPNHAEGSVRRSGRLSPSKVSNKKLPAPP